MLHSLLATNITICYLTRAMRESLNIVDHPQRSLSERQISVERVDLQHIRLPLKGPFETSFGRIDSRLIFLVSMGSEGPTGWGEVAAAADPRHSYETVATASHVIRDNLAQALTAHPIAGLSDLAT